MHAWYISYDLIHALNHHRPEIGECVGGVSSEHFLANIRLCLTGLLKTEDPCTQFRWNINGKGIIHTATITVLPEYGGLNVAALSSGINVKVTLRTLRTQLGQIMI